jgi:hypothetical protein
MTEEAEQIMKRCQAGTRNYEEANNLHAACYGMIGKLLKQLTERPVDCERCNRLEEQAYDLVGKLRVANIKLSMQPRRTWVGLTDDEQQEAYEQWQNDGWGVFYNAIEAKLKEKNNAA